MTADAAHGARLRVIVDNARQTSHTARKPNRGVHCARVVIIASEPPRVIIKEAALGVAVVFRGDTLLGDGF